MISSWQWFVIHWQLVGPVPYAVNNTRFVNESRNICWWAKDLCHKAIKIMITALKSNPQGEIQYHNIVRQPGPPFQSLHYPWCRFLIYAETCAIPQGLLSQEKLYQQLHLLGKKCSEKEKSHSKHISFYFDLLHILITITKGLCSDVHIFTQNVIYFLAKQWMLLQPRAVCFAYWGVCSICMWLCVSASLCKSEMFGKRVLMSAWWQYSVKWIQAKFVVARLH